MYDSQEKGYQPYAADAVREGKPPSKVRRAVKGFCELKYLIGFIGEKAREMGAFRENPTAVQVTEMYQAVNEHLIICGDGLQSYDGRRDGQLVWRSMAKNLRAQQRRLRSV